MLLTDAAFFITLLLLLLYVLLLLLYTSWFRKLKLFALPAITPVTRFSIIIPARDEEAHIGDCLAAILQSGYPSQLYEVIVIDDHSTDGTSAVVKKCQEEYANVQLIQLANIVGTKQLNAYKKKAVESAIDTAIHEWIITTDADCIAPAKWLFAIDAYIQNNDVVWVAAPVRFTTNQTWISIFQALDFLGLQGITAASVSAGVYSMCNGANLAYKKTVFKEVGGFKGIDDIASGDDMLLMEKITKRYPHHVGYLFSKEAIVDTEPMPDWKSFINQRIRWASKSTRYKNEKMFYALAVVYLLNLMILLFPVLIFFDHSLFGWWIFFIAMKTIVEFAFLNEVASFFDQQKLMGWFFILQPVHIFYTVIAGWMGKFGSYRWKGRTVN